MTKTKPSTEKPSAEQAVRKALRARPDASAAELAAAAGLGRSTVSKLLAELERGGEVRRRTGGREGGRRMPDRWSLCSAKRAARAAQGEAGERLRPGALDGLVLDYMTRHEDNGPFGPGMIAKALSRSSGAVANSLVRLARSNQVRQVGERPLRYSPAA